MGSVTPAPAGVERRAAGAVAAVAVAVAVVVKVPGALGGEEGRGQPASEAVALVVADALPGEQARDGDGEALAECVFRGLLSGPSVRTSTRAVRRVRPGYVEAGSGAARMALRLASDRFSEASCSTVGTSCSRPYWQLGCRRSRPRPEGGGGGGERGEG